MLDFGTYTGQVKINVSGAKKRYFNQTQLVELNYGEKELTIFLVPDPAFQSESEIKNDDGLLYSIIALLIVIIIVLVGVLVYRFNKK